VDIAQPNQLGKRFEPLTLAVVLIPKLIVKMNAQLLFVLLLPFPLIFVVQKEKDGLEVSSVVVLIPKLIVF